MNIDEKFLMIFKKGKDLSPKKRIDNFLERYNIKNQRRSAWKNIKFALANEP